MTPETYWHVKVVRILQREYPHQGSGSRWDAMEADLLDWADTLSDDELLRMRQMGSRGLAFLRALTAQSRVHLSLDQSRYPWTAR